MSSSVAQVLISSVVSIAVTLGAVYLKEQWDTKRLVRDKTLDLRIALLSSMLDWESETSLCLVNLPHWMDQGLSEGALRERNRSLREKASTFVRQRALALVYLTKEELDLVNGALAALQEANTLVIQVTGNSPGRVPHFDLRSYVLRVDNARLVLGKPLGIHPDVWRAEQERLNAIDKMADTNAHASADTSRSPSGTETGLEGKR